MKNAEDSRKLGSLWLGCIPPSDKSRSHLLIIRIPEGNGSRLDGEKLDWNEEDDRQHSAAGRESDSLVNRKDTATNDTQKKYDSITTPKERSNPVAEQEERLCQDNQNSNKWLKHQRTELDWQLKSLSIDYNLLIPKKIKHNIG